MSASLTKLYYDRNAAMFRQLPGGAPVWRVKAVRRDTHYFAIQMFDANRWWEVKLNTNGVITTPSSSDKYALPNITDQTTLLVGVKSRDYDETSDYEAKFTGFVTNSDWTTQTYGAFTAGILLPSSVAAGENHYIEFELVNASGARWTLPRLTLEIAQDVNTGAETNAPTGVPGGASGDASISDSNTSTGAITVTGLTSTGFVHVQVLTPTGTPGDVFPVVAYSNGSFSISNSVAPGTGNAWNFRWTLARLS